MKRLLAAVLAFVFLCGCGGSDAQMERAMALRERLLSSQEVSFSTQVTADFGDETYTFGMSCKGDSRGDMEFAVTAPESISGITGNITDDGGSLTFDNTALGFSMLADGEVSAVSAPWLLLNTLRGGYLKSCGMDGNDLRLTIDDSYENDAMQLDIWLDSADAPVRAEILWQGRRILYLTISGFQIL